MSGKSDELSRGELLVLLMEECAEVIMAASKCLRFGYDHEEPGYGRNSAVLANEMGDVLGIVDALELHRRGAMQEHRHNKIKKVIAWKKEFEKRREASESD